MENLFHLTYRLYLWVYVYDDAGEVLYEAGCYQQQVEKIQKLNQELR